MSDNNIQIQIDEVNRKLDLLLEETLIQRQNRDTIVDLVDDLSLVGKDAFKGVVDSLDNAGVEIQSDELNHLFLGIIRNIGNFNMLLSTLESVTDLLNDAGPIIKQVGIDAVDKFNDIDQKGYIEIIKQLTTALDTIMARYSKEDLQNLSDNIVTVIDTFLSFTDPAFMKNVNLAVNTIKQTHLNQVEKYTIWKIMREFTRPEMKNGIGYMMTFFREFIKAKSN